MNMQESLKALSHHAYCLVGGAEAHAELVSILEKKHKIRLHGNPDLFDRSYETFTIDDAREVKSSASMKPVTETGKKLFILTMSGITVEAQNALLKVLEEPPAYAHFFLIIPSAHLLIPTVKSRMSFIDSGTPGSGKGRTPKDRYVIYDTTTAEDFVRLVPAKRLDIVKKLMDDISKEKKTKQDAIDFLNGLEESIHEKGAKQNAAKLEAIETARRYMNDRSPSLKMLLEYVALEV